MRVKTSAVALLAIGLFLITSGVYTLVNERVAVEEVQQTHSEKIGTTWGNFIETLYKGYGEWQWHGKRDYGRELVSFQYSDGSRNIEIVFSMHTETVEVDHVVIDGVVLADMRSDLVIDMLLTEYQNRADV